MNNRSNTEKNLSFVSWDTDTKYWSTNLWLILTVIPFYRVTPSGRIEDEGDFTDFFAVPDNIPEEQRSRLQQLQDEVNPYLNSEIYAITKIERR